MNIVYLNGNKIKEKTIAAIGFFDGVHLAHRHLIQTMKEEAKRHQLNTAVITFDVHPKSVIFDIDYFYVTPLERKIEIIKEFDIDTLYLIEFTKEKAHLSAENFISYYLNGLEKLVCGFDFRFGNKAQGNVETLQKHATFETVVIEEMTSNGQKIGSTTIRELIQLGHVDRVKETLGDYYTLAGNVVDGDKRGHEIGYPTANIDTGDYLIPKKGVYASFTQVGSVWYRSMSSIGYNPTLNLQEQLSVETHILNFTRQIYGETIRVKFIQRLRDEEKFASKEALIKQMDQDLQDTLIIFENLQ